MLNNVKFNYRNLVLQKITRSDLKEEYSSFLYIIKTVL